MRTDELDRLERRLEAALHDVDDRPVDVAAGRALLGARLSRQQHQVRRWTVVGVAASVLAVVVTTSLLVAGLREDSEGLPVAPPKVTLSPSGLPVGSLEGLVPRTSGDHDVTTFRLRVRPDGTGNITPATDAGAGGSGGYHVELVRLGPGRVALRYEGPVCAADRALTLTFTFRGRTLRIDDAESPGCLVGEQLTADLPGTILRIKPLPLELSPSGLPVGTLEGKVTRSVGTVDVSTFRLTVRPDGTGTISPGVGTSGAGEDGGGYDVEYVRLGSSRVGVRYEGPVCSSAQALTFSFTIRGRTLTIDDAESPGCLVNENLTSDLAGTTLRIMPLPTIPAPADGG